MLDEKCVENLIEEICGGCVVVPKGTTHHPWSFFSFTQHTTY